MPELPEVEVVRAGLAPAVVGARILGVDVRDERALTRHAVGGAVGRRVGPGTSPGAPSPAAAPASRGADFESRLAGRTVRAAVRRGKFLWFPLEGTGEAIVAHLGMSGQMLLRAPGTPAERHERIRLAIEHPDHGELAVVFADQRTFGSLGVDALVPMPDGAAGGYGDPLPLIASQAAHIARDPLDPAFSEEAFRAQLARRRSAVKRVLLDQGVVSGIGNIYADEALWAARIHPETTASALATRSANRLLAEVRSVLRKALAEGGTSFDAQYVNVNGQAGMHGPHLSVHRFAGYPCKRCGTSIVRERFMNRSSYLCPVCQRKR
ncbi:bifunctional DNA-formamidopyrimidine glycosylase/DNA-(apurinic or apyrimidinic site) lyase [Microbacterium karelineae]|uniref:bifunctional DNA-formamidopyrimidine glycosylase/DNA-(apurinic or apyrimidinic site) lyase n=1 Tax=Microbacterium karelineae TaxID=2654283 RepID=UPI0012E9EE6E|nr:bifunctional DNA-formamidopyrimidine glycosylase/DNA-(apurinic or apyrimidinic site) lyase [Microbacterium karelineae]